MKKVAGALEILEKGEAPGDDFLAPVFRNYYKALELPNLMEKSYFHKLVESIPDGEIDPEITEKLDAIAKVDQDALARQ